MQNLEEVIVSLVPVDGSTIGNITLRAMVGDKLDRDVDEAAYAAARPIRTSSFVFGCRFVWPVFVFPKVFNTFIDRFYSLET